MQSQYFCKYERRRQGVRDHPTLNGIDYLEVLDREVLDLESPRQRTLLVRCIKPLPDTLSAANVEIHGGVRITPIRVAWAARAAEANDLFSRDLISGDERVLLLDLSEPETLLVVRTDSEGDYSPYRLRLVSDHTTLTGFDPMLAEIAFSFKVECPSEFDCVPRQICPAEVQTPPPIDYLSKDYASFRRLMLDRLSVVMPDWQDHLTADLGVALVEILAYGGDYLSYFQDAAATEAYLGTARRRLSIRRHARLLDYTMHDGCNARAWVALRVVEGVQNALLERVNAAGLRTRLFTRMPSLGTIIPEEKFEEVVARHRPRVFEPVFDLRLFDAHNDLYFYTWQDEQCCLPAGATRATLRDDEDHRLLLLPGDVLIFEEVRGPGTGAEADADPTHRHVVRLTVVDPPADIDDAGNRSPGMLRTDELNGQPMVDIEWAPEDALPFPLCISTPIEKEGEEVYVEDISMARGNVVLIDHGRTLAPEPLDTPTGDLRYRPWLKEPEGTRCVPFDLSDWNGLNPAGQPKRSAARASVQDPAQALPAVLLRDEEGQTWRPARDLLASNRFDSAFALEMESNGRAQLRFGDNLYGKVPEADVPLTATYRIGNGPEGNAGAEAIAHILTTPGLGIADTGEKPGVRNPLPAVGGTPPESLEEVRQYVPQAFRRQDRAVTEADYADVAQRHLEVARAVARRRWTGSWHTLFIAVDRIGGLPVNEAFEAELCAFLERFQLATHDVEIEPPRFVPLDIALSVCVWPGYLKSDVKGALLQAFSRYDLPDGGRGYFHPDNFTFGTRVFLSRIISAVMDVPGVRWVSADPKGDPPARFQRWGDVPRTEISDGFIPIGRLEIARLDNDPNAPENGRIEFHMEGGL